MEGGGVLFVFVVLFVWLMQGMEMAQLFRALDAPAADTNLVPSNHMAPDNYP